MQQIDALRREGNARLREIVDWWRAWHDWTCERAQAERDPKVRAELDRLVEKSHADGIMLGERICEYAEKAYEPEAGQLVRKEWVRRELGKWFH